MKVLASLVVMVFISSILSGCLNVKQLGYVCEGQSKDTVLKNLGPPEEVKKSVKNFETWTYPAGDGVKSYTFEGDTCIDQNSHRR